MVHRAVIGGTGHAGAIESRAYARGEANPEGAGCSSRDMMKGDRCLHVDNRLLLIANCMLLVVYCLTNPNLCS